MAFMGSIAPLEDTPNDHIKTGDAWWSSVESSLLEWLAEKLALGEYFYDLGDKHVGAMLMDGRLKELTDCSQGRSTFHFCLPLQ